MGAALSLTLGCSHEPPIIQYQVPTTVPAALTQEDDRMIAAILPQRDQAWFFKILGPISAVSEVEVVFREFVEDVQFDGGLPTLKSLPSGWRRGQDRAMRFASIDINTESKQLDLSISQLSRMDDWPKLVAMNVNRWRGQVGLGPSEEPWAGAEPMRRESENDAAPAIWVDIRGKPGSGTPPMMGGSMGAMPRGMSPIAGDVDPHAGLPQTAREAVAKARATEPERFKMDSAAQTAEDGEADEPLEFDAPDGWRPGRMSMMRLAAFNAGPDDAEAEITVINAGGDLRGNVARWMGQVLGGAPDDTQVDQIMEAAEKRRVGGRDAQRFLIGLGSDASDDASGDADSPAIDATIVPLEDSMSLFIKMSGPASTVRDQGDAVEAFLDSLRF